MAISCRQDLTIRQSLLPGHRISEYSGLYVRVTGVNGQLYWKHNSCQVIKSIYRIGRVPRGFAGAVRSIFSFRNRESRNMQKGLCITALSISALVLLLFLADILLGLLGMQSMAPYKSFSMLGDAVFMVIAALIAWQCWSIFRKLP